MKLTAFATCVLLCGYATTIREIRDDPPRATYTSSRSIPELEHCLAGNLSWIASPAIIHGPNSSELAFGSGGSTAVLVTLENSTRGTNVQVREMLLYGTRIRHNVEACVEGRDS